MSKRFLIIPLAVMLVVLSISVGFAASKANGAGNACCQPSAFCCETKAPCCQ